MQKILNLAVLLAQGMVKRCKSHNRIQQWIRLDSNLKKRGVEEAAPIVLEKVMVMGEVVLMVVEKELKISR